MALPFLPVIDARQQDTIEELLKERRRQLNLARQPLTSPSARSSQGRGRKKREQHPGRLGYVGPSTQGGRSATTRGKPRLGMEWLSRIQLKTETARLGLSEMPSQDSDVTGCGRGRKVDNDEEDSISLIAALHLESPNTEQDQHGCSRKTLRTRSSEPNLSEQRSSSPRLLGTIYDPPSFSPASPPSSSNAASPPIRPLNHSVRALPSTVDRIFPQRQQLRNDAEYATLWFNMRTFPATEIFRACARMLVTPFGDDFVLDPLQLNSTALFFHPTGSVSSRSRPVPQLRVLGSWWKRTR
jgi:hypothetical protein